MVRQSNFRHPSHPATPGSPPSNNLRSHQPEDVVGNLLVQVRVRLVNHDVQQVKAAGVGRIRRRGEMRGRTGGAGQGQSATVCIAASWPACSALSARAG